MMHDFGVTQDYAVFHVVPIVSSWERLKAGLPTSASTPRCGLSGVLPRHGDARALRWFKSPTLFASHVMNAFNDGTRGIRPPVAKNNMFPFFPDVRGAPFNPIEAMSFLTRGRSIWPPQATASRSRSASLTCSASFHASTTAMPPGRSARLAARVRSGKAFDGPAAAPRD